MVLASRELSGNLSSGRDNCVGYWLGNMITSRSFRGAVLQSAAPLESFLEAMTLPIDLCSKNLQDNELASYLFRIFVIQGEDIHCNLLCIVLNFR